MPFFQHDGIRFHYDTAGQGPAVVFCHGLGGDSRQPMGLFHPVAGHTFVFWDCRGHGRTEPLGPDGKFTFATFASDLAALLDHLKINRCVLAGISMGAGVAIRFATQWPHRVERLFLIRPAWLIEPNPPNLAIFPKIAEWLERLDPALALEQLRRDDDYKAIAAISSDVADSLCRQIFQPNAAQHCIRLRRMPASAPIKSWHDLGAAQCPALVIGTDRDPVHPIDFARKWAAKLPQADFFCAISKAEDAARHAHQVNRCLAQLLRPE